MVILYILFGAAFNGYFIGTVEVGTVVSGNVIPKYHQAGYPSSMFIPSLFFPFYGAAQYYETTVQIMLANHDAPGMTNSIENDFVFKIFTGESWKWTITFLQPWIYIFISLLGGTLISKTN